MKTYRGIRDPDCHVLVWSGPARPAFGAADPWAEAGAEGSADLVGHHAGAEVYELHVPAELLTRLAAD